MDTSDIFVGYEVSRYMILVVCANWKVTLGGFDVQFSVSTMGSYMSTPRKGYLGVILIIFGCLKHHMKLRIVFGAIFL